MLGISLTHAGWSAASALQSKQAKLKLDNKSIEAGMAEAGQKASNAMSAATTGLVTGIVSGAATIGSAVASTVGFDTVLRGPLTNSLLGNLHFLDGSVAPERRSDATQIEIGDAQAAADAAQAAADASKEATTEARDRRKSGLDNIQKFLDILRSMNPQI